MLFVAGRRTNLWAEGYALTASSESPRLPVANLANGDPATPAASAVATSPWDLVLDGRLRAVTDPHFDGAWSPLPAGWGKAGPGTLTRDTVVKDGGVASVRFDVDAGDALLIFAGGFEAACGSVLDIAASFRRQAASYGVVMYLLCVDTGLYWSVVDQDWRPLEGDIITTGDIPADAWTERSATGILVPDLANTDVARLLPVFRHRRNNDAPTARAWLDNVRIRARANLVSVHFPRALQGAELVLATSPDAAAWTDVATIRPAEGGLELWAQFAPQSAAWWRLRAQQPALSVAGTGVQVQFLAPPAIGESVLALARKSIGSWRKAEDEHEVPQARAGQGGRYRQAQAGGPRRRVTLDRMGARAGDVDQVFARAYKASLGGVRDLLLVWDESVPSRVVLGALEPSLSLPYDATKANTPHRLTIAGYAPPIWGG